MPFTHEQLQAALDHLEVRPFSISGGVLTFGVDVEMPSDEAIQGALDSIAGAGRIASIKAEANRRITEKLPIWKQNNLQGRFSQLDRKDRLSGLTQSEVDEMADIEAKYEWTLAVRAYSDQLEADPSGDAYGNIGDGWPEL